VIILYIFGNPNVKTEQVLQTTMKYKMIFIYFSKFSERTTSVPLKEFHKELSRMYSSLNKYCMKGKRKITSKFLHFSGKYCCTVTVGRDAKK
jgi:hypothetical protein